MATKPISLRPASEDDAEFLYQVYAETHGAELGLPGLPQEQAEQLLRMQFEARNSQYHGQYPDADNDIILRNGVPVGFLCALRGPESYVLIFVTGHDSVTHPADALLVDQSEKGAANAVGQIDSSCRHPGKPWRLSPEACIQYAWPCLLPLHRVLVKTADQTLIDRLLKTCGSCADDLISA